MLSSPAESSSYDRAHMAVSSRNGRRIGVVMVAVGVTMLPACAKVSGQECTACFASEPSKCKTDFEEDRDPDPGPVQAQARASAAYFLCSAEGSDAGAHALACRGAHANWVELQSGSAQEAEFVFDCHTASHRTLRLPVGH